MRLIAIIADGAGRVDAYVTRSPDLLRRELSDPAGSHRLLGVTAAPKDCEVAAFAAEVRAALPADGSLRCPDAAQAVLARAHAQVRRRIRVVRSILRMTRGPRSAMRALSFA